MRMPEYRYLESRVAANTERDSTERKMDRILEGKRSLWVSLSTAPVYIV